MKLPPVIYLAPFQGITGYVFREAYTRHFQGIDKFYTPFFTSVHKEKTLARKGNEIRVIHHNHIPLVPQILSKEAAEIIRFGNFCHELGFEEINWNLGCPFPRVAHKKRGSGLLPWPDLVRSILDEAMPRLPISLSVKCRLGYHSSDELIALLEIFESARISELSVHARIGKQIYKGEVNLPAFESIASKTSLPLAYNGDIFSLEDFESMSKRFPTIKAWMIGRGLLADPFLSMDIKTAGKHANDNRAYLVKRFLEDLYLSYRKEKNDSLHTIGTMKELWGYLAFSFDNPVRVFSLVKKCKSFEEYENAVVRVFEEYQWLGSQGQQYNTISI